MERVSIKEWSKDAVMLPDGDHAYTLTYRGEDTEPSGAIVWHRLESGDWAGGAIQWVADPARPASPVWELRSLKPLHVEPSIRFGGPDNGMSHGWIRGDRWEPAGALPAWASEG